MSCLSDDYAKISTKSVNIVAGGKGEGIVSNDNDYKSAVGGNFMVSLEFDTTSAKEVHVVFSLKESPNVKKQWNQTLLVPNDVILVSE